MAYVLVRNAAGYFSSEVRLSPMAISWPTRYKKTIGGPTMKRSLITCVLTLLVAPVLVAAAPDDRGSGLFDHRVKQRRGGVISGEGKPLESLVDGDAIRLDWRRAAAEQGGRWNVWLDERTSMPTLVLFSGLRKAPHPDASLDRYGEFAGEFLRSNRRVLGDWDGQAVLDREGSGPLAGAVWLVRFGQVVEGVPVEGARIDFHINRGRLVSMGAERWAPVLVESRPGLDAVEAQARLTEYLRPSAEDGLVETDPPELVILPLDGAPGLTHRLVWRFRSTDSRGVATWTGEVDAHTGSIFAFYDDTRYDRIKGHVNPIGDTGICVDQGCPEPDYPMPYADYTEDGGPVQTADYFGHYSCTTPGSTIETTLDGPYFRILDTCGSISATTTCDGELDLGVADATNCAVASGAAPGNTDAARSAYYGLNLVNRKARFWISGNPWLESTQVDCKTNTNGACNASWGNNTINMFHAAGGCGNTAQIQAVLVHEWGHGFDENDGGDFDNSSEAYADVAAIFEARESCVGHGFRIAETCAAYGDTCLTCTGVRDLDWDARQAHTPATPTGFLDAYCPSGGGPCGKETHCESYVPAEAMYDLATRDLPAMGIDPDTAWQLAERLWYQSRPGSGGDIFNCALPASDSCAVGSWYHQLRVQDDDDGDLANGTPHASAIFSAFDRHDIACGQAADAENQETSSCPALDSPQLAFTAHTNAVTLDWDAVADAGSYRIYRNENGCERGQYPIAEVTGGATSYLDTEPANGFPVFYRVQTVGSNPACEGPVSTCVEAAAQRLAGRLSLDRTTYGCNQPITLEVTDLNHPTASMTVTIRSDTETLPETVVLAETSVGSARFVGTIPTVTGPATADGMLSVTEGDLIVAEYADLDDGAGGVNVVRQVDALSDCMGPVISLVRESGVTDFAATIEWATDEPTLSKVRFGTILPPDGELLGSGLTAEPSVWIPGLDACTTYYYEVESVDPAGNLAVDDRNGSYFRFETMLDAGSGPEPCNEGRVTIDVEEVACASTLPLTVADPGLDQDSGLVETVNVSVSSSTEAPPERLVLTETAPGSGVFVGSIPTLEGAALPADGVVQVADGDTVTAVYLDGDDGTGSPNLATDVATVDCRGPELSAVVVTGITDKEATVQWTTSEPTAGMLEWGPTPTLGNVATSTNLTDSHSETIGTFAECSRIYFRITSTDALDYTSVFDLAGAPFGFNAGTVGGVVYRDNFESDGGWTLGAEWEIDAPQGLGSAPGDPPTAFQGSGVLGHDLTGLGSYPGDYEPGITVSAVSPVVDLSALTGVELQFHRWLNVLTGTLCHLQLSTGGPWTTIWQCPSSGGVTESSWSYHSFDLSPFAAGSADVQLRFRTQAVLPSSFDAGWNVDQLILRDTSQQPFAGCEDCGGAPTFAGAASVKDDDRCADSGITLSWQSAPAWGTGASGSYAIYRDVSSGFTPGPGNLLAAGVSTNDWTDPIPPTGVTLYYIVRAESDETCSDGPNNGGTMDENLARVAVVNETGQTSPGSVGNSLRVAEGNDVHAALSWDPPPGAAAYHVYRSAGPVGDFRRVAATAEPSYEAIGAMQDSADGYYLVRAADACGNEGP